MHVIDFIYSVNRYLGSIRKYIYDNIQNRANRKLWIALYNFVYNIIDIHNKEFMYW